MAGVICPPDVPTLQALIALNSWTRSDAAHRSGTFRLQRVIYRYKGSALVAYLQARVDLSPVPVYVTAVCRDCGGSGLYVDEWGYQHGHCWRCRDGGFVRLEFVQTTLPNGAIWHTPRDPLKCPSALLRAVQGVESHMSEAWDVGRKGHSLSFPDLAAALNLVEDWHGDVPERHIIKMWDDWDVHYYRLPLGIRAQTCAFCDGELAPDPARYLASDLLLSWGDWCCASCSKKYAPHFPPFAVPVDLLSDAAVQWLKRREGWARYQPARIESRGFPKKAEGFIPF
jgi:hypothetical protein